jgi:hypothetical protein
LEHGSGRLDATDIIPQNKEAVYLTMNSVLGHPNNAILKETAKFNNIQLTNVHHRPCQHCLKAKI